jgi:hypothetical protein
MRIDFGRLILFLVVCIIGQFVISYAITSACLFLGIRNYRLIQMLVNIGIGFFLAWLYRPAEYRRGCFKDPNFYRDAGIFALIFIVLDLI